MLNETKEIIAHISPFMQVLYVYKAEGAAKNIIMLQSAEVYREQHREVFQKKKRIDGEHFTIYTS